MAEQIITKTCRVCKEIKPISEFYKRVDSHDGYRNDCRACCSKYTQEYHKTEKGKVVRKSAQLRYSFTEKGKACNKRYKQTEKGKAALKRGYLRYDATKKGKIRNKRYRGSEKGKAYFNRHAKHYAKLHPEHNKAIYAVKRAIIAGKLPRPDSLQCHYCPARAEQYHHHKGYEPEHRLDVIPVCRRCHYFLARL